MSLCKVLCLVALFGYACFATSRDAESSEAEVPSPFREGLSGIADRYTPMEATYIRKRTSNLKPDDMFKRIGYKFYDHTFLDPLEVAVILDGNRIRSRITESRAEMTQDNKLIARNTDILNFSFDGKLTYNWSGEKRAIENTILFRNTPEGLMRGGKGRDQAAMFRTEPFQLLGIDMANIVREIGRPVKSRVLGDIKAAKESHADAQGGNLKLTLTFEDGTNQAVLVDQDAGYLNREFDIRFGPKVKADMGYSPGVERLRGVIEKVASSPTGRFVLPETLRIVYFSKGDVEAFEEIYTFSNIKDSKINDDRFVITDTRPGVTVADGTIPLAEGDKRRYVQYQIPANPRDLDETIEFARSGQMAPRQGFFRNRAFYVVNALAVVAIIGFLLFRYLRKR